MAKKKKSKRRKSSILRLGSIVVILAGLAALFPRLKGEFAQLGTEKFGLLDVFAKMMLDIQEDKMEIMAGGITLVAGFALVRAIRSIGRGDQNIKVGGVGVGI